MNLPPPMNTAELSALLILATAASFTPGPNTTLSTALAAKLGFKKSLRFVLPAPVGWPGMTMRPVVLP